MADARYSIYNQQCGYYPYPRCYWIAPFAPRAWGASSHASRLRLDRALRLAQSSVVPAPTADRTSPERAVSIERRRKLIERGRPPCWRPPSGWTPQIVSLRRLATGVRPRLLAPNVDVDQIPTKNARDVW